MTTANNESTRRVLQHGSSKAVTLPAPWVPNLHVGDTVRMIRGSGGTILIKVEN